MKYLRLFEDISNLYEIISYYEYDKLSERAWVGLTQKEESTLDKLNRYILSNYGGKFVAKNGEVAHYRHELLIKNNFKHVLFFIKLPDEWFILASVNDDDYYYKCDQFEGLVKCIEDITK